MVHCLCCVQSLGQGPSRPLGEEWIGAHRPGALGMQQSSGTQPSLRTFDYTGEQLASLCQPDGREYPS